MSKDTIQKIVSLVTALILLVAAFYFVLGGDDGPLTSDVDQQKYADVEELKSRLNDIEATRIDPSLFSLPAFESLEDLDREVFEYPVGKDNPFEAVDLPDSIGSGNQAAPVVVPEGEVVVIDLGF